MGTRTITKKQLIRATPERVFKALTQKEELERWFVKIAEVELKPGGTIRTEWAPGVGEHGTVKEVKPPRLFRFTWEGQFSPTPTTISFELTKEQDSALLTLTHSGIGEGKGWEAYANMDQEGKGWEAHLKDLTSWIETGNCPPPGPRG
ncbi:MAG TPA: SRPBCC domain-containing protein [Bacteroidota bacterium]|nr:SRPBCC domain-containing protein [Bacteroidota bacterium]